MVRKLVRFLDARSGTAPCSGRRFATSSSGLSTVFYDRYASAAPTWGLSALDDQRLGGMVMLAEGSVVLIGAFAWVVLRALASDRQADAPALRLSPDPDGELSNR